MASQDQSPVCYIDSSSLIALRKGAPPDLFPGPWEKLTELAAAGRLMAPREVRKELEEGDDELVPWAVQHAHLFRDPTEVELHAVIEIQAQFPDFVDPEKEKPEADPFVVALALVHNRLQAGSMLPQPCVVISEERRRRAATGRPKIPDVCDHYGIEHMNLFGLMRAEGWTF